MITLDVGLPKWPLLVVEGSSVDSSLAEEILVRTDGLDLLSNDHEFFPELLRHLGLISSRERMNLEGKRLNAYEILPIELDDGELRWFNDPTALIKRVGAAWYEIIKKLNLVQLEYLHNQRIVSAYIGGPHGWMNWDGIVGCNTFNIGKWPSAEDVFEEWTRIAEAFPILELWAQLFSGENCEEGTVPLIEYTVKNGKATYGEPSDHSGDKQRVDALKDDLADCLFLSASIRERGIQPQELSQIIRRLAKI